jgi:excisionase family DNA binding protein
MPEIDHEDGLLFTYAEAAQRLSVRQSWLENAVQHRLVPHRRLGRQVRFTPADLAEIVEQARTAPVRRRAGR